MKYMGSAETQQTFYYLFAVCGLGCAEPCIFWRCGCMQNMIKQIVEMDQKAQQITENAQQEKLNSEKKLAAMRDKIREEYLQRARRRIALNEPQERAAAEAKWQETHSRLQEISKRLEETYAKKGEDWVNTLTNRVLGK